MAKQAWISEDGRVFKTQDEAERADEESGLKKKIRDILEQVSPIKKITKDQAVFAIMKLFIHEREKLITFYEVTNNDD